MAVFWEQAGVEKRSGLKRLSMLLPFCFVTHVACRAVWNEGSLPESTKLSMAESVLY